MGRVTSLQRAELAAHLPAKYQAMPLGYWPEPIRDYARWRVFVTDILTGYLGPERSDQPSVLTLREMNACVAILEFGFKRYAQAPLTTEQRNNTATTLERLASQIRNEGVPQ